MLSFLDHHTNPQATVNVRTFTADFPYIFTFVSLANVGLDSDHLREGLSEGSGYVFQLISAVLMTN